MQSGQLLAIISAALFGTSPVLCKMLIGEMSPALLAGLLYLGSGIALESLLFIRKGKTVSEVAGLPRFDRWKLAGSIVTGGIMAPLCLTYGIKYGSASEVTLLLNLETVATTIISWLVFREHIGPRVWWGKFLILTGAAIIVSASEVGFSLSFPGSLVVIACIFWGIDNNLTRELVELSSTNLAGIKGLFAGGFNIVLALLFTAGNASVLQLGGALTIGALSYGVSLVLFIEALRKIGAARTSTLFAVGPFIGTLFSVTFLGERPPLSYWLAAALMIGGVLLLFREKHGHLHTHEPLSHGHSHVHDEHHGHDHQVAESEAAHDHPHDHDPLTHIHVHWPDIHHRHGHGEEKSK